MRRFLKHQMRSEMPGFYKRIGNQMQWRTCSVFPDGGSFEVSMSFWDDVLPRLKQQLSEENCDLETIKYSVAKDGSGKAYIAAEALASLPQWVIE